MLSRMFGSFGHPLGVCKGARLDESDGILDVETCSFDLLTWELFFFRFGILVNIQLRARTCNTSSSQVLSLFVSLSLSLSLVRVRETVFSFFLVEAERATFTRSARFRIYIDGVLTVTRSSQLMHARCSWSYHDQIYRQWHELQLSRTL